MFKNSHLRKKFFFSYLLVFVLPFFLLGLLFFYMTFNALKENSEITYQNMLDNAVDYLDNEVDQLCMLTTQMSRLDWVSDIMKAPQGVTIPDEFDENTLDAYRRQISAYLDANGFIEEIAIYFNDKDYCLSTKGSGDLRWMLSKCLNMRDANVTDWQWKVNGKNDSFLFPITNIAYGQVNQGLIYIQSIDAADGRIGATVIASVRRSVIDDYLASLADKNEYVAWITTRSGKVIFGENHMLGRNGLLPEAEDNLLFCAESPKLGLEFRAAAPKQVILKGAYTVRDIALVLVVLLGILGWLLSMKLAGRNYKPIGELMGFLKNQSRELASDAPMPADEFAWLTVKIKDLLRHEDALKQRLEKNKPSLMELYLIKLVEGNDQSDLEFHKGLDLVGISFPYKIFCSGIISSAMDQDKNELLDAISAQASGKQITYYTLSYCNATVVVFNYNDVTVFESIVKNINYRCNAMKRENLYLCFGSQGQYLSHIRHSYEEAITTFEYRLLNGESCVMIYDELYECDHCYYYPIGQENILTNHLCNGEYQKAVEIFNEVIEQNIKMNTLSPRDLKYFFVDVQLTVFKAATDCGLGNLFKLDLHAINKFNTIHDISVYIKDIMLCFCKAVKKIEIHDGHPEKDDIMEYLDGNITNPMLSLYVISSHYQMSPSYFSRYFQEKFSCCFLDHVNARRIEIAKKMIADNRNKIGELSTAVGYGNDVTFRRIFKKYEGVSPTQYREMQKRKWAAQ